MIAAVVAVLVIAVIAVVAALALNRDGDDAYPVGSCVTQHGGKAASTSCDTPGAYRVTKRVADRDSCPDPNGPVIELQGADGDRFRCLSSAE
ncbi:MAG TPA: hypothetical protein VGN37_22380 [Actinocatenispora sp.]